MEPKLFATALGGGMLLAGMALADQTQLDLWTIDDPGEYHYVLADEYMKLHPDVKINVRTVQFRDMVNDLARAMATGEAPDITYIDNPEVALFASRGLLADLDPYIAKSKIVDQDDIYPGPLASVTWKGKIYGLPRGANTIALYYNADMFRAAGLDPDKPPQTWDELYADAKALTHDGVYGLAFSAVATEEGTFQFLPWVQMTGGDYKDIDTQGAVRALTLWKKFIDEGLASPDTLIRSQWDSTATFDNGSAAMAISGPWELPRMSKEAHFDFRAAPLPLPEPGATRASALGEGDNVILKSSKNPEAAFAFLEYCWSQMPRVWNEFGYLPAASVEVKDPKYPAIFKVFDDSMAFARNRGPEPQWPKVSKAIQTAMQTALTGQVTPEAALATAQKQIDAALK